MLERCGPATNSALTAALAEAAAAIARLGEALASHPLRPAFLYRGRLDAVRRQAAVDGLAIDPWPLAAVIEGLRLRLDHALHIVDRGAVLRCRPARSWLASVVDRPGVRRGRRDAAGRKAFGRIRQPGRAAAASGGPRGTRLA